MTPPWKSILVEAPTDGATVWIARLPFFDQPIQATWDETNQRFDYTDSNTVATHLPFYVIFKWRPL